MDLSTDILSFGLRRGSEIAEDATEFQYLCILDLYRNKILSNSLKKGLGGRFVP